VIDNSTENGQLIGNASETRGEQGSQQQENITFDRRSSPPQFNHTHDTHHEGENIRLQYFQGGAHF